MLSTSALMLSTMVARVTLDCRSPMMSVSRMFNLSIGNSSAVGSMALIMVSFWKYIPSRNPPTSELVRNTMVPTANLMRLHVSRFVKNAMNLRLFS